MAISTYRNPYLIKSVLKSRAKVPLSGTPPPVAGKIQIVRTPPKADRREAVNS